MLAADSNCLSMAELHLSKLQLGLSFELFARRGQRQGDSCRTWQLLKWQWQLHRRRESGSGERGWESRSSHSRIGVVIGRRSLPFAIVVDIVTYSSASSSLSVFWLVFGSTFDFHFGGLFAVLLLLLLMRCCWSIAVALIKFFTHKHTHTQSHAIRRISHTRAAAAQELFSLGKILKATEQDARQQMPLKLRALDSTPALIPLKAYSLTLKKCGINLRSKQRLIS